MVQKNIVNCIHRKPKTTGALLALLHVHNIFLKNMPSLIITFILAVPLSFIAKSWGGMANPWSRRSTFAAIDQLQAQIAHPWPEVCTAAVRTIIETPGELRVARCVRIGFVDYEPEQCRVFLGGSISKVNWQEVCRSKTNMFR